MALKKKDVEYIQAIIENEGFDYTYRCKTSFEKIKDVKFHELREAYIKAANDLDGYVGPLDE